jgi:hypothetical protein
MSSVAGQTVYPAPDQVVGTVGCMTTWGTDPQDLIYVWAEITSHRPGGPVLELIVQGQSSPVAFWNGHRIASAAPPVFIRRRIVDGHFVQVEDPQTYVPLKIGLPPGQNMFKLSGHSLRVSS